MVPESGGTLVAEALMSAIASSYTQQITGKPRITYEEFLDLPEEDAHSEWVDGEIVPMPSVNLVHARTAAFLVHFLRAFLEERPLGEVFQEPFQVRPVSGAARAPDLMVLLHEHRERLQPLFIDGPADLVIEIVSPSGARRDYVEKFREYEAGGVPEYWVIDPENREASFFLLREGRYEIAEPEADGSFRSRVLDGFWLKVDWLWERPSVRAVLGEVLGE